MIVDSHCHIQETEFENLDQVKACKLAVMGTLPSDWEIVAKLAEKYPSKLIPCFGVHPWFAESSKVEDPCIEPLNFSSEKKEFWWISLLEKYLKRFPYALVGEIGIDKSAVDLQTKKPYDFEIQQKVLHSQFQLAARMHRSVSIHCVQAFGALVEIFKEVKHDLLLSNDDEKKRGLMFPPKIMLHSFSGSSETAKALKAQVSFSSKEMKILNKNIGGLSKPPSPEYSVNNASNFSPPSLFYSLSELVNLRSEKKLEKLLSSISIDSILIESDCGSVYHVDEKLHNISSKCASILNMDVQTFHDRISENNKSFFCR